MTLWKEDAAAVAAGVRRGDFSAADVLESHLERIRSVEPRVHAFARFDEEDARRQAAQIDGEIARGKDPGPLSGVPVAVKDNLCVKDRVTSCASRILDGFRPVFDATAVGKARDAGALLLTGANMDEFAMGSSTENSAFGPTRNPWNDLYVPGGSSGGSAAALAAGMSALALGSDTGGSVRQPAGLCGVVAFKPRYGAVSRYGLVAFASSLDQVGPMARSARDCALLYNVIAGRDPNDSTSLDRVGGIALEDLDGPARGRVLGIPRSWIGGCDADVLRVFEETVGIFEDLGVRFADVELPKPDLAVAAYYILADAEASSNLARYDGIRFGRREPAADLDALYRRTRGAGFGFEVKRRILLGTYVLSAGYYEAYYARAQRARGRIQEGLEEALQRCDALLVPTTPGAAFRLGERIADPVAMYLSDLFTITGNLAGGPVLAFPAGFSAAGLPVGMQLYGRSGSEAALFGLAAAHERTAGIRRLAPPD